MTRNKTAKDLAGMVRAWLLGPDDPDRYNAQTGLQDEWLLDSPPAVAWPRAARSGADRASFDVTTELGTWTVTVARKVVTPAARVHTISPDKSCAVCGPGEAHAAWVAARLAGMDVPASVRETWPAQH